MYQYITWKSICFNALFSSKKMRKVPFCSVKGIALPYTKYCLTLRKVTNDSVKGNHWWCFRRRNGGKSVGKRCFAHGFPVFKA